MTGAQEMLDAARRFVAPYVSMSDELLRELAAKFPDEPSRINVVMAMSITAHSAQAIIDFRRIIAKAEGR